SRAARRPSSCSSTRSTALVRESRLDDDRRAVAAGVLAPCGATRTAWRRFRTSGLWPCLAVLWGAGAVAMAVPSPLPTVGSGSGATDPTRFAGVAVTAGRVAAPLVDPGAEPDAPPPPDPP